MTFQHDFAYPFGDVTEVGVAEGTTQRNRDLGYDDRTGKLTLSQRDATLTLRGSTAAIRQAVLIRLRTHLGEYYLDESAGVDYFGRIATKTPNLRVIKQLLVQQIKSVPGVTGVPTLDPVVDRQTRRLSVSFTATTTTGTFNGRT